MFFLMFFPIKRKFFYGLIHGIIGIILNLGGFLMSNTTLHNENVSVTLKSLGAELTSIKDASGTEYLWQANPDFWSGQAPVLFPIVGCLRNGTATIGDNKTCSFGRHGLARRLEFDLVSSSDTSVTYSLRADDKRTISL